MYTQSNDNCIYFRVDMNAQIATGHVMRCLSIADAAKAKGIEAIFICADNQPMQIIHDRGYECIVLDSDWQDMEAEIPALSKILMEQDRIKGHIPNLVVDSYQITQSYLDELTKYANVTYIDDLNSFRYPVNNVVVYAPYYKKWNLEDVYNSHTPGGIRTKLILGPDYIPLRSEFQNLPEKKVSGTVYNVLVLSGGSDNMHITRDILEKVTEYMSSRDELAGGGIQDDLIIRNPKVTAICGRYNQDYEFLRKKYHAIDEDKDIDINHEIQDELEVKILQAVPNLMEYIRKADVIITAGGTTLYEICACGTPAITYSFADNQIDNVKQMAEDNLMEYAGDIRDGERTYLQIVELLKKYENPYIRRSMSRAMQRLVDGHGAERIVDEIQ